MNKITYDLNSYQIKNLDFKQALNKGQVDSINMKLLFELDDEVKFDLSWQVWVTFERPDGSTSTNMLATLDGKYYELTIGSWFTDIAGIGFIQVRIKQAGVEIYAFPNAKIPINDGINAIGTTIDEEEYNTLLRTINNVNNKIEAHKDNKNNPHNVTAEQLNVYEKEHVDLIDVRVVDAEGDILGLETDNTLIKERLDDVENLASKNSGRVDSADKLISYLLGTLSHALNSIVGLEKDKEDKETTIIGLDLKDNILIDEFREALGNATQINAGLLSVEDKTHLDGLVALLETSDGNNVVDTIGEILAIFQNYPEGADLVTVLQGKVDKVEGKGLSTNDFTNTLKTKLDGIEAGAEVNVQSDWGQTNTTADDFIKNKPTIPKKTSDLTNDKGYITGYTETDPIFTAWNKSTGISITKSQITDLIEATQSLSGLMSATDKQRLDVLHALLEENTTNNVVDSINEVLAIFNNYPEGADLVSALAGKVDKNNAIIAGTKAKITYDAKGLVTGGADLAAGDIPTLPASKITQTTTARFVTDTEKSSWNSKQSALGFTPENQANKKTILTNNDVDFPTTKAVKTAIDTAISQTLKPMGNWNASTNSPTLTNSDTSKANQVYYVSVTGTQFGINFDVGDELVYNTNGVIFKRDNVDAVISVNGKEGVVVLTQDDVVDGSTYKRVTNNEKTTWNNKVASNTAIIGATKTKITYDAKGLVISGSNLADSDIPELSASKITSGRFTDTRIPDLNASKINAGIFAGARIPQLAPSKITQDATNRFVTDAEKTSWNGKLDANSIIDGMTNRIKLRKESKSTAETIKETLLDYELIYITDTNELGVKKINGLVEYFRSVDNADDVPFNGAYTNYLENATEVKSAIRTLDSVVKTTNNDIASKEKIANKVFDLNTPNNTTYATTLAVKTYVDTLVGNSVELVEHGIVLIPDTTFTITQTHFNKTLIITSSSNVTITVPTKIVESIEKGFFCDIVRYGTGEVSFSGAGIVLNSAGPLSIDAQYIASSLIKIDDNNEWLLIGGRA